MWEKYMDENVVPDLRSLSSEEMLLALYSKYKAHISMIRYWSGIFFKYLDRPGFFTAKKNLPTTRLVGDDTIHP